MAGLCLSTRVHSSHQLLLNASSVRRRNPFDGAPRRLSFLLFYVATLTAEPANIVSRCNRNHDIEAVNGADIHNLTRSAFDRWVLKSRENGGAIIRYGNSCSNCFRKNDASTESR